MILWQCLSDISDHVDQLIKSSYLTDLDAHFDDHTLENSEKVVKQMFFVFLWVLCCRSQYNNLAMFLTTILDWEPPLLHFLDGLVDQYLIWKIEGQTHKTAFKTVMKKILQLTKLLSLSSSNIIPVQNDNSDWVHVQCDSRPCSDHTLPAPEKWWVPVVLHLLTYLYWPVQGSY